MGCEHSGVVRDAFTRLGHVAYSCDLLPSESPGLHKQGDLIGFLDKGWDILIAHPPCTYLSVSGIHWTIRGKRDYNKTIEAVEFAKVLIDNYSIPRVCVENPISILSSHIRNPDQVIQPYQFGHNYSKSTCLWLKGLPKLTKTKYYPPRITKSKRKRWGNQTDSGQNIEGPSDDRWKIRSKTFEGIANAMALQWGGDTGWRRVLVEQEFWLRKIMKKSELSLRIMKKWKKEKWGIK